MEGKKKVAVEIKGGINQFHAPVKWQQLFRLLLVSTKR